MIEPTLVLALAVLAAVLLIGSALPCYLLWRIARQAQLNSRRAQTGMLALSRSAAAHHVAGIEASSTEEPAPPREEPRRYPRPRPAI